ncbi:Gfo/Idh/MocA family protein [Vibrio sp. C8]
MKVGVIGLGGIFEVAYSPALQQLQPSDLTLYGFDPDPARKFKGMIHCESLEDLLAQSLDTVLILTPPELHLDMIKTCLSESDCPRIIVEKPVVTSLAQVAELKLVLNYSKHAKRLLALDHWMCRDGVQRLFTSGVANSKNSTLNWRPLQPIDDSIQPINLAQITKIEAFLLEKNGFNDQGEPVALNFSTGEIDRRQFQHPDGVILDIGTHVLAMIRELLAGFGMKDAPLSLQVDLAEDRLSQPIAVGDVTTAEGHASLSGFCGPIPISLELNKYAGPVGGQKGFNLYLDDGRVISMDRSGDDDVVILLNQQQNFQWQHKGTLYLHCVRDVVLNQDLAGDSFKAITQRRIEEVESLLLLQQSLRGVH